MRLAKFLATAGIASRRRAEDIIRQGRVKVNDEIVDRPQAGVGEKDLVTVDGEPVKDIEKKLYILLHKPDGFISTVSDTHNRPTVMDLVQSVGVRIYPVGRLDFDTSGALLLTNDGNLAYRLTHPRYGIEKIYLARVKGLPKEEVLQEMRNGLVIDGIKSAPARVKLIDILGSGKASLLEIVLTEGRKRQIKKMCSAVGHPVEKLHRRKFAGLSVENLEAGSFRYLSNAEIKKLYNLVGL